MEGPRLTKRRTDIDISSREKIAAIKGSDSERDQSSNFWVTDDTDSQSYPKPKFGVKVDPLEIRQASFSMFHLSLKIIWTKKIILIYGSQIRF